MNSYGKMIKRTPFTLDTLASSSSLFNHSQLQKEIYDNRYSLKNQFKFLSENKQQEDSFNLFTNRSKINYRQRYLFKVLGHQENQSLQSLKNQNIFIFDWDDTLLCTTYISSIKFAQVKKQYKSTLNQLDQVSQNLLKLSSEKGYIYIISNSALEWMIYSSKKYLPKTHSILFNSKRIKILSARDLFQELYPQNLIKWKVEAFKKIKQNHFSDLITNMVVIGDGQQQMIAAQLLSKSFEQIYLKKIKFESKPTPQQLLKQLKTLQKRFQQIFSTVITTSIKLIKRFLSNQKQSNKKINFLPTNRPKSKDI